ncbi:MAG: spore germination protein, partial [Eubacteriales bacterium]|nr:spore germination protein [Eubacteriales bacterium]
GVPFPLTLEIIVMLLAFELLKEAGIKAPSGIGQAVSIVGGLVLGQAAVEAKLVSAPVVIVVAFAGITGLTLPKLRATVLVLRMALQLMAAGWGLFGLGLGVFLLLIRLSTVRSFGIPILSNLISVHYGNTKEDILIRYPWSRMKKRGRFISRESDEFLTAEGKRK